MSAEDKKYNGWNSYETWLVNLWLTNDQYEDSHMRELAQEAYDNATADEIFTRMETARKDLAETLKNYLDEMQEEQGFGGAGLFTDMINAALREVDWHDLAESFLDDVDQQEEEREEE